MPFLLQDHNSPYVYTSLHILKKMLTSTIFIVIHILFDFSKVNFNQKLYDF
jgi:hypothetical protein